MATILMMKPVFKEMIWGGSKLRDIYGYDIPSDKTGECWAISAHHNGDCTIDGGIYDGMKLSQLYNQHRELFGNIENDVFPLMVKIIDANKDLSVQVHPNDEYAGIHENSLGKAECWYVLDCNENTNMVMGHNAKTKEELVEFINNNDYDSLLTKLNIKEGDFFDIKTGTIHAICSGSLIYEAQQSSDITYRVYDYDRRDDEGNLRQLHVEQSIDVTTIPFINDGTNIVQLDEVCTQFVSNEYFSLFKYSIKDCLVIDNDKPFMMVSVIEGNGSINGIEVIKGSHCLVCSDVSSLDIVGCLDLMICTL